MEMIAPLASPLGWYWIIAPLAVSVLGVLLLLGGIGKLVSGHAVGASARLVVGGPLAALGFCVGLLALNTQSFVRLTHEIPVADISVAAANPEQNSFTVTISRLDGVERTTDCDLTGDEWQMSARVQKWKPWANVLGLDTTYVLDQIANKYSTAERGSGQMITACDLAGPMPVVNTYIPPAWLGWLIGRSYEDRRFGSAVYMPLVNGAVYRVVMTQSGLNAEAVNEAAASAIKKGL